MQIKSTNVVKTSDVIGNDVYGKNNEKLGEVKEIVIAKLEGEVRYAVLTCCGVLGIGEKYYAVPWKALDYCKEKEAFQINMTEEQLKTSQGFDKDHWPDFTNELWIKSTHDYFGL